MGNIEKSGKPKLLLISDSCVLHTGMAIGMKEIATRLYKMDKYEIRTFGWFAHTAEQRGVKWNLPWRQYTTSDHARPYGHPQGYPLNPNWDTCPVVKIIDDFKPDVVIVIGDYWMCFPAGTNIKTPHGTKKIEDIVEGDDVYTHKGRIRQVKKTLKRKYNGDLIKIDYIGNNKSIYCTPEHPFLKSPDEFIKAEKLKVGDFLLSPITEYKEKNKIYDLSKYCFRKDDKHCWEKTSKKHNRFVSLDSDLCRTIGYYLAEGYCSPRGVYFTFSSKEKTIAKDLSNTIYDKIGIKSKILYFDTYIRVQFHSRILSLFFKELCDTGSRDKKLHNDLLHLSEEKTIQIIKGYFLGDGHIDKNRSGVSFTTRSKFLAYQIKNTIERLGIIASIYERLDERRLKTKSCGINFVVHIGGIDKNKFKDIMGFKYEVKKGSHSKNYIEDGYIYRKIKNITHIKAEDIYVYNFEVEEDNSYVANEIAVHNCEYLYDMPNRSQVKLLHEMPIDGSPIPMSWIKAFKKADIPIVMSEFAVDAIKEKDEYFKVELNPRGLDTSIFFPQTLDRPKDFLRKNFMSSAIGRFVVGIFNRFQDRKQIGRSIEAFSKFVTKYNHKDCDLYLHCDFQDSASIQQGKTLIGEDGLLKRYGLDGKILFNKNITVEQGVSAQELAATYNCCDVVLNTTQGEGFGWSIIESLACGIPNIVTNYTTPVEFAKSGGIKLIDVITTITGMYNVERALADTDHAADLLEELYRSPKTRKDMGIKGAEWAKQFNWENNIQNWVSYIERCLRGLEYKPISKTKERVLDLEPNVNIQGAVFENTGFSIVTKNLAKALDIIGVNVSLEPRVPHLAKFFKVEDRINKLINKDKNTVFEFINHMGQEQLERLPASKAKYKIAYFPWELSNIKNEWVDGLNKYADAVWCNSQFTSDIYKNAGIQEDKLFVLPNGICFPEVDRERDDDKTYKFLCIGNLGDKRKNVETLIQSYLSEFNGDEDVELILKTQPGHIDSDPTELVEFLSRSKTNAPKITIIHADYTDEALAQLMKNCDCFVTASHAEGFCHPILEATSMGMPVIAPMYGGYLEFAQNGKFFGVAVDISEATKSPVYYYNSRWSNVKFRELMRVMREVFVNKIMPDGINYVPEHTWENTAIKMRDELKNVAKRASRKKTKIYYHNFTYNLWNNDNRTNFMRYAPSDIEFVDDFENADLQIIDITRLSDKHNIKCKNYIALYHCRGEISEENIMYYADIFQNAQMVYSHLDLEGEMTGSDKWTVEEFKKRINFFRGPWGVDEDLFFNMSGNQKAYTMLTTGAVAPTEAIAECLYACQAVKGKLLHIGPNMFQNAEGYLNTRNLTIREMSASYSLSYYTNAMRRIEGFEKVFSEGVLSSSRPICFDTPLYRHWYKDIPRYVKEGTPDEVIKDLIEIFKSPYKPITEEEKQFVIDNFSWIKVSKKFWKNFKRIRRTKDDRSN